MSSLESSAASPTESAPCPAAAGMPLAAPRPGSARSGRQSLLIWLGGSVLVSVAIAWLAFQIRLTGHAPELLFPIGVGLGLGIALAAVLRRSGSAGGRWAVAATIVWGLLVVLGQEYFAHLDHRRNYLDVQNRPNVPAFARLAAGEMPPPGFAADLIVDIRYRGAWLWSFDALAIVLSAAIVVACHARTRLAAAGPTALTGAGPAGTGRAATD